MSGKSKQLKEKRKQIFILNGAYLPKVYCTDKFNVHRHCKTKADIDDLAKETTKKVTKIFQLYNIAINHFVALFLKRRCT